MGEVMDAAVFVFVIVLLGLAVLGIFCLAAYRRAGRASPVEPTPQAPVSDPARPDDVADAVTFAPPEFAWSGSSAAALPIKILSYKQYDCLEDARYGFNVVGRSPTERALPLAPKTRAHGLRTVASLAKHGFLVKRDQSDQSDQIDQIDLIDYIITDSGLNALEVCSVRY